MADASRISGDDPFEALGHALADVVRAAVADALDRRSTDPAAGDELLLPLPSAAARLGLGVTSLKRLISDGELPSRMVCGRRLVSAADLEAFVAGGTRDRTPETTKSRRDRLSPALPTTSLGVTSATTEGLRDGTRPR